MHDSAKLITAQGKESRKRTYLFYISECYRITVLDFTDRKNKMIYPVYNENLLSIIANYVGYYTVKDLYCNELTTVKTNEILMLPCAALDKKFFVWFVLNPTANPFKVTTFAKATTMAQIDRIGRNSIISYTYLDYAWIMSSSVESKSTFTLSVFDISKVYDKYVEESFIGSYNRTAFSFENGSTLPYEFNLRDLKIYSTYPDKPRLDTSKDSVNQEQVHNIIASCFNNGILFFQALPLSQKVISEKIKDYSSNLKDGLNDPKQMEHLLDTSILELTHAINITEAGRLFTLSDYYSTEATLPFKIFVTHATPASVYEISVNEHFNPNIVRVYKVPNGYSRKFIGEDVLSVTKKYIAHLMFDLEDAIEVVRIYYRNESNFAYGHSDLRLTKFLRPVTSIHFLDMSDSESLFVKNAYIGNLYHVNDVEFVIDTKNNKKKYQSYINQTFIINITAFNLENQYQQVNSSFRLTFAGKYDMNSYFVGSSDTYYFGHGYGDPSFSKVVSDLYYGPDLKFDLALKSNSEYHKSLLLPNITSTKTMFNVMKLHSGSNCTSNFFNRFLNETTQVENIAFYCIHEHMIEQHIFDTELSQEIEGNKYHFPRYKFIDFFVVLSEDNTGTVNDTLIMLSDEPTGRIKNYYLHYFDVRSNVITWSKKILLNIQNYELRSFDPLIEYDRGTYLVFIDKYETTLFFVCSTGEEKARLTVDTRVQSVDFYGDLLFLTYYDAKRISVYKVSRYTDEYKTEYLTVEYLNDFQFDNKIIEYDTLNTDKALVFSKDNLLELFEIVTPYRIDYIKKLPFFKYADKMRFYIKEHDGKVAFTRFERFLYVILVNKSDIRDKKLFCFNMKKTVHDSLYSVIPLDRELTHLSNNLFIEGNMFDAAIYIYLFYGGQTYQLIKFEPENLLKQTDRNSGELFLPKNYNEMHRFEEDEITLQIYPTYEEFTPSQNKSVDFVISCRNYGLKIESRLQHHKLEYQNQEGEATLSLLDYFDGFNNTFGLNYDEPARDKEFSYNITQDSMKSYLLEAVNANQKVIFSMEYNGYVLVFYENQGLLQLYKTENEITKVTKEFNYDDLFDGCSIDYISYSSVLDTDDSILIVNCRNFTGKISPAYQYKVFRFVSVSDEEIVLTPIFTEMSNRRIINAQINKCPIEKDEYALVVLQESDVPHDTDIFIALLKCHDDFKCSVEERLSFDGLTFGYDNFKVNSFMFVRDSTYILLPVDGFGLVLFDLLTKSPVELIPFEDALFDIPPREIEIYKLAPIGPKGVRIFLKNNGGFSLYWDTIKSRTEDSKKLVGLVVRDRFESTNRDKTTDLIASTRNGYAQVIYYPKHSKFYEVYVRVFNYFNPTKTKNYREYKVDEVMGCESLDTQTHENGKELDVILACGYRLYIYHIHLYPSLTLRNHDKNSTIQLQISSWNANSMQSVELSLTKNEISPGLPRGIILVIFLAIIITSLVMIIFVSKRCSKGSKEEEPKGRKTKIAKTFSKSLLKNGSRLSYDNKRLVKSKLTKVQSMLEPLTEEFGEEGSGEIGQSEKSYRRTMNYGIQMQSVDSFITEQDSMIDSELHNSIRMSYKRSSTREFQNALSKKCTEGYRA